MATPCPARRSPWAREQGSSTISAASGVSNASGVVTFTVTDTNAETVTYTATDTTDTITPNDTGRGHLLHTWSGVAHQLHRDRQSVYGLPRVRTRRVTVTLEDSNGNAVPNKTVTLTTRSGSTDHLARQRPIRRQRCRHLHCQWHGGQYVTYTATDVPDNLTVGTVKVDLHMTASGVQTMRRRGVQARNGPSRFGGAGVAIATRSESGGEAGAVLVLALLFLVVVGGVVGSLATWAQNDLNNTAKFTAARSVQYAADSATEVAIQDIRYSPLLATGQTLNASPPTYCWNNPGTPELPPVDGVSMDVWCSTAWNPSSANTRVVTFSTCHESHVSRRRLRGQPLAPGRRHLR